MKGLIQLPLTSYPMRMTRHQAAAFLNCTPNHIQNLVDCGQLEAIDISAKGNKAALRIKRESLEALDKSY